MLNPMPKSILVYDSVTLNFLTFLPSLPLSLLQLSSLITFLFQYGALIRCLTYHFSLATRCCVAYSNLGGETSSCMEAIDLKMFD